MSPFLAVYHHPLGYDSYRFSFLTGYQCSRSVTGDVNYLEKQHWPIAVSYVTCGISATIVRCFLIFRYWRLSVHFFFTSRSAVQTTPWCLGAKTIISHLYWSSSCSQPCVSPILGLQWVLTLIMQLGSFVGVLVSGLVHMAYVKRDKILLSALCVTVLFHCFSHPLIRFHVFRIWFSTNAASDISIALALLWQLSQIKSPFKTTQRCVSSYYRWLPTSNHPYAHII